MAAAAARAHRDPPDAPVIVPARPGDATFVAGDRLFVVSAGPEPAGGAVQNKIISTYALPAGTLLSDTTVAVTGAIFDVTAVRGTVLVSYQVDSAGAESTVALAAGTDHAIWRRPARMIGVSAADGLVLLRKNSPQFGPLNWYGVDLATGAVRWRLEQPVRGYITEVGDAGSPSALVTVNLDGVLSLRDPATAAITAETTITVPADWPRRGIALWPDGDLVLAGDQAGTTAYELPDLAERWHAPVGLRSAFVGPGCGDAVCLFSPRDGGVTVLDRATGRTRWASERWTYGDPVGGYLLAGGSDGKHLDVVNLATGRLRGDLGPWRTAGALLADGSMMVLREPSADNIVWYGRLDSANLGVQDVGAADGVSGDCEVTGTVLVCRRVDGSAGVWRLTRHGDGR
jgi:outer membrane protein assembly factor BamB